MHACTANKPCDSFETNVKKNSLTPVWGEVFTFKFERNFFEAMHNRTLHAIGRAVQEQVFF
jgi:hypothetical protein